MHQSLIGKILVISSYHVAAKDPFGGRKTAVHHMKFGHHLLAKRLMKPEPGLTSLQSNALLLSKSISAQILLQGSRMDKHFDSVRSVETTLYSM